eukprot:TRINITY_DN3771_c0_g1_i2.p1 TRINITY_DN3771_c0_g1~~TRINITY_DN3771_c0_g1_i2.p1  ORF type:complete len:669 (+),score=171.42 TRINITY_DN3771_c0_g1_i2:225-2231(+)
MQRVCGVAINSRPLTAAARTVEGPLASRLRRPASASVLASGWSIGATPSFSHMLTAAPTTTHYRHFDGYYQQHARRHCASQHPPSPPPTTTEATTTTTEVSALGEEGEQQPKEDIPYATLIQAPASFDNIDKLLDLLDRSNAIEPEEVNRLRPMIHAVRYQQNELVKSEADLRKIFRNTAKNPTTPTTTDNNTTNTDNNTTTTTDSTSTSTNPRFAPTREEEEASWAFLSRFEEFGGTQPPTHKQPPQQQPPQPQQPRQQPHNRMSPQFQARLPEALVQYNEGEWDAQFVRVVRARLSALVPKRAIVAARLDQGLAPPPDAPKRMFRFADDLEVPIGGYFVLSQEYAQKHLSEGVGGTFEETTVELLSDRGMLFREVTHSVIASLDKQRQSNFSKHKAGIVLTGPKGSGKSVSLTQISLWARRNGWIVIRIPDGKAWASYGDQIRGSRVEPTCYDQRDLAQLLATQMLQNHGEQLQSIPIRTTTHVRGFERNSDSTLYDLLKFATEHESSAVDAVHLFRRDLSRVTEFPVLIAVDNYNGLYHHSDFFTPEDITRGRVRQLPAQRLTMSKIFSNHLDHGMINGTMVCAVTETSVPMKHYRAEFGDDRKSRLRGQVSVPNYSQKEFAESMRRYQLNAENSHASVSAGTEKYILALTQGNPKEINFILAVQ